MRVIMELVLVDRKGKKESLSCSHGETAEAVLRRYDVPPCSVVVLVNGEVISDLMPMTGDGCYEARLIEGYDLNLIRGIYRTLRGNAWPGTTAHAKQRVSFDPETGGLNAERADFSLRELSHEVETTVLDTCRHYGLIKLGEEVMLGLSGGVDSASLLMALNAFRREMPFRLSAVTFEDYDAETSPTYQNAKEIAEECGIRHHIASAKLGQEVFNLSRPISEVLCELMDTTDSQYVMYIDHHTTRRTLEVFADQNGISKIALGLHVTDLIAGFLNEWFTGYSMGDVPKRQVGPYTYIYPLAFVTKKELHCYHLEKRQRLAQHSRPNSWELNPQDRNFYYYLADLLQTYWPGLETMLFVARSRSNQRQGKVTFEVCANCGSNLRHQVFTAVRGELCDACSVFSRYGYLR